MHRSKIEWCRNPDGSPGWVWNPITGCLNGCPYCYARKLANGRLKNVYRRNKNTAPQVGPVSFKLFPEHPFYPRFWPERIPVFFQGKAKGVFVCDMSDLFGIGVPEEWTREVLGTIKRSPSGWRFYLLTKQPQNLIKFSPFPDNCWVGVTATNSQAYVKAINGLAPIKARIKYISFEPLLGNLTDGSNFSQMGLADNLENFIGWVIIGAQTKPYKPPKIEWVSEIIDACVEANIPYFLKNNLEPVVPKVFGGDGNLIQEMPIVKS